MKFPSPETAVPLSAELASLLGDAFVLSDEFALTHDSDGEPLLYRFADPEHHFRISDNIRILLSCFQGNRMVTVRQAAETFFRHLGGMNCGGALASVLSAVQELVTHGVLVRRRGRETMYSHGMVPYYLRARQVPSEIGSAIASHAGLHVDTSVLDIGTGTGGIALTLAEHSQDVTGIDVCVPCLEAAKALAKQRDLRIKFIDACGNKLVFADEEYDVITICQAFHWLNPYWATRGIYGALRPNGLLYVIESKAMLSSAHPFRTLLGWGYADRCLVEWECNRHTGWYGALFHALKPPDCLIHGTRAWIFHQRRPFDLDFARAFFSTDGLRQQMRVESDPWERLCDSLAGSPPDTIYGDMYWLLIELQKSSSQTARRRPEVRLDGAIEIAEPTVRKVD